MNYYKKRKQLNNHSSKNIQCIKTFNNKNIVMNNLEKTHSCKCIKKHTPNVWQCHTPKPVSSELGNMGIWEYADMNKEDLLK